MAKSKTSSHVVTRRMYATKDDEAFIDKKMNCINHIYNVGIKYVRKQLNKLYRDQRYIELMELLDNEKKEVERRKLVRSIFELVREYDLTEYSIHKYLGLGRKTAFEGLNANIVQKCGTQLYAAVKKAIIDPDKMVHYRKFGTTNSFEGKNNSTGIIYKGCNQVTVMGRIIDLKPVRDTDRYMMISLIGRVKYCRVVRRPDRLHGYKYYLQIIIEGEPVKKLTPGNRRIGIDDGTSTIAAYDGKTATFDVIAPDVEEYNKAIAAASRKYERRTRLANTDCYNEDGTPIKGKKCRNWTNGRRHALQELKHAYRRKTEYIRQWHNHNVNAIITRGVEIVREPMNWRALARRAKQTSRSDKASVIKKKDGTELSVCKYKRKKRFGSSISNRSPGYGQAQLERRVIQYGGSVTEVDPINFRASQYHHDTGEYIKPKLSERTKNISGHIVSRDLYSAFLLYHAETLTDVNDIDCISDFNNFLSCQEDTVLSVSSAGDITRTFGIAAFMAA